MKVMLVLPLSIQAARKQMVIFPPLGLGYLGSVLEQAGHKVKIVDSWIMNYTMEDVKKEIKQFDPDVVGVTAATLAIYDALDVAKEVKEHNPNSITVLGGPHPTFTARELLKDYSYVDVVVRGEGERTFEELLEKKKADWKDVKGISFKSNGNIINNKDRCLIKDLDSIPFPAYHLLPMKKYKVKAHLFQNRVVGRSISGVITSRGCPNKCIFCSSSRLGGRWRARNPENIIAELKLLRDKYGKREIEFLDDTFSMNEGRVKKICNLIIEEDIDISWLCQTRVNLFTKKNASLLKKAGCHTVMFGIESGSQKTLDYLNKDITLDKAEEAVKIAKDLDFDVCASFLIGIPGETKKMVKKTIAFAKKLNPKIALFYLLTPYPGTTIYEMAKEKNLLLTKDWSKYAQWNSVMKIPGFKEGELQELYIGAYRSFYLRPYYIFKPLRDIYITKKSPQHIKKYLENLKNGLL